MTMRAELADGRILEFPDGTDPSVIQNTVKKLVSGDEMSGMDKAKNIAGALVEPAITMGTGMAGSVAGGLAGLGAMGNRALGFDTGEPGAVSDKVREAMTYQPRTQGGKAELEFLSTPFRKYGELSDVAGESSARYTGSPAYGAVTNAMMQTAPALVGGKNIYGKNAVAESMLKQATGRRGKPVLESLKTANPELTAGQATVPARSTETSALLRLGEKNQPTPSKITADWQQEGRMNRLENIARPDERAFMERIRGGVADNYYSAGRAGDLPVQGVANVVKEIDTLISQNPGASQLTAKLRQLKKGLVDSKGNIRTDAKEVMSTVDGIRMAMENKEFGPVQRVLSPLKKSIVELSPKYKEGDKFYAQTSRPITQMKVAEALMDSIGPKVGSKERPAAFGTAIANEKSTLRKANNGKRPVKNELSDAMSKEQMNTINAIAKELDIDADYRAQATAGMPKAKEIINEAANIQAPHILSTPVVILNSILRRLEGKYSKAGMDRISELGRPENRGELIKVLEKATDSEKQALIDAIKTKNKTIRAGALVSAEQEDK